MSSYSFLNLKRPLAISSPISMFVYRQRLDKINGKLIRAARQPLFPALLCLGH
jgi:hypothetical protein